MAGFPVSSKPMLRALTVVCTFALWNFPTTVSAEQFVTVEQKSEFVSLISGKQMTRFGIRLEAAPDGQILGRGFGRDVTVNWNWQGGYFCRDLVWGSRDLGFNCQMVQVNGDTVRFISDKGTGQYADLKLR
ncbi:MAG: hypothetical protein ACI9IV_001087 [Paracoccaceae bacterium]|jgi:hypothetical protein